MITAAIIWNIGIMFYLGLSHEPGSTDEDNIDWMAMLCGLLLWPLMLGIHIRGLVHKD